MIKVGNGLETVDLAGKISEGIEHAFTMKALIAKGACVGR
jgi:hypothetical protein